MAIAFNISDPYIRRARLQPGLLVALPLALAVLAWSPAGLTGWGVLWSVLVWSGATALLTQVARDRGKRKEPELFRQWGGKPTTVLLRHRDNPNLVLLDHRHAKLRELVPSRQLPTAEEEKADPARTDQVYEACTLRLIEKTRDRKAFPLVFEENCNYGFRRNLWGMKPVGILTAALGTGVVATLIIFHVIKGAAVQPVTYVCGGINLVLLVGWITWFTPAWVRIAADAYAARLLAACDGL